MALDRKRVLVVEDEADLRTIFRHALAAAGFDVTEAGDGYAALRLIDSDPPDLIVLDLMLPLINGIDVQREIAAQGYAQRIPVVVVTGSSFDQLPVENVACILRKPVPSEQLTNLVKSLLSANCQATQQPERPDRARG